MLFVLIGYEAKVLNPFVGKKPRHKKDPEINPGSLTNITNKKMKKGVISFT
jgi:hypothetical protein